MFFAKYAPQIIIGILVIVLLGLAWWYWDYSQNKIDSLSAQNALLNATVTTQNATIATLQKSFEDTQKELTALSKNYYVIIQSEATIKNQFAIGVLTDTKNKNLEANVNKSFNSIFQNLKKQSQVTNFGK